MISNKSLDRRFNGRGSIELSQAITKVNLHLSLALSQTKKKRMDSITYIWVADEDVRLECGLVQDMAQAEV